MSLTTTSTNLFGEIENDETATCSVCGIRLHLESDDCYYGELGEPFPEADYFHSRFFCSEDCLSDYQN